MSRAEILVGDDGKPRCGWIGVDPVYRRYHDEEWGTPLHGDRPLFEKICLEGFQAGLSWITILRRREGFRDAFDGFELETVAAYDDDDVERLMADERIIRNRAKVLAAIGNARVALDLTRDRPGTLDELIWGFAPSTPRPRPRTWADIPAVTPDSEELSAALRKLGFRFVGPTTLIVHIHRAGVVDHPLPAGGRARGSTA